PASEGQITMNTQAPNAVGGITTPIPAPAPRPGGPASPARAKASAWSWKAMVRALIGTGSPFPPASYQRRPAPFAQTNNSYIFPGLAIGILTSRARNVSDAMVKAATLALVELLPTRRDKQAPLLPPLKDLRAVS